MIDDEVIVAALRAEDANATEGKDAAAIFLEATTMALSFRGILKIANLQGLQSLTKLCLDNNAIEEIANLGHLVNLTWLDLSYNRIAEIRGLDALVRLTDLTLCSNRISSVDGLSALSSLECLSLGHNRMEHDQLRPLVLQLRPHRKLKVLSLEGNPLCAGGDYRAGVLAFLDGLRYLDYAAVPEADARAARDQFQDELLDLEEKEARGRAAAERAEASAKASAQLAEANLVIVEAAFDVMFGGDTELARLKALPGHREILDRLTGALAESSEAYRTAGLRQHEDREREVARFLRAVRDLRADACAAASAKVKRFAREKKAVLRRLAQLDTVSRRDIQPTCERLEGLVEELMDLEVRHADQYDQLLAEFEPRYDAVCCARGELQRAHFATICGLEARYASQVSALVADLLARAAAGEAGALAEDARRLLADRAACTTAIAASHDARVGALSRELERSAAAERRAAEATKAELAAGALRRNRARVQEICELRDAARRELGAALRSRASAEEEGGDE